MDSSVVPKASQGRPEALVSRMSERQFSMIVSGTQNSMWLELVLTVENQRVQHQGVPESFPSDRVCNLLSYKPDLIAIVVWS